MQTQHGAIKIGESCLAVPLLGEQVRRRAGDGRHGEALRELAQALVRVGRSSAIVLGAGIGEWAADLIAGGMSSLLCVEDDMDSYSRLSLNVSPLGLTHQALVAEMPAAGGSPVLTLNQLLRLYSSFEDARLLAISARFGLGALASALDFIGARRPVLMLEVRLDSAHAAGAWERTLERLAELGLDSGLAFDPLGHPLGSVTPARVGELIDALESSRTHGGGLTSLTLLLASVEWRGLLGEVRASMTKRARAAPAHRIAVVRLDNLGDHVLGAGIFSALRASFPQSRIVAVIPAGLADLYARCPNVDAILTVPPFATYIHNPSNWAVLIEYLRGCSRFDLVINPRFADDYYAAGPIGAALAAPGARIIGFRQALSPLKNYDPNNHFSELLQAPDTLHAASYASILAQAVTGRPASAAPEVWWKPEDWQSVAGRFGVAAEGFIVVGIGTSHPCKLPSPEIYRQVIRLVLATSWPVVLVGSAAERGFADLVRGHFIGSPVISTVGSLRLPQLAALLAHARLYVGPDAGPKHIAAAARTPVVEIGWVPEDYPATSRGDLTAGRCWTAWGTQARTVYPDKEDYLRARGHPHYKERLLTSFNPQQFERALAELLSLSAPKARLAS
jgi:heptosyltransferase-3